MEPVMHPVTCMAGAGSSPKSPRQNISPSSRNSPAADRWTSATSSNESIASPKQDCAICLGKLKNECFTDSCLHKFCFSCLVKWSKVKPECPLCQQSFKYIIQNVRSIEDYDEYHLQTETENPDPWNSMLRETWIEEVLQQYPEELQRMIPWLTRELYAVLRGPGLSRSALKRMLNLLSTHDIHSRQFWLWVESYLRNHCDHFIHDFYNFARSPYDMIGFDENAVYSGRSMIQMHVVHEVSCDSSDSDAIILPSEDTQRPTASLRKGTSGVLPRSRFPVAGPSRAVLPVDEPSASDANAGSSSESNITLPTVLQELARGISSTEAERSASDSCVFVGYVKPLHERTPEIISLPSSDQEGDVKESSQMDSLRSLTSSLMSRFLESSRSEYDPRTVRKSQKKKVNRKSKCDGTAKCKAKTSNKGGSKTTPTSTKKRVKTKPEKPQKMLTKKGQSHRQDEVMNKVEE